MASAYAEPGDRPQWSDQHSRNMVSDEKGLPATFDPEKGRPQGDEGERVQTRDLVGAVLLVRVRKVDRNVRTKFNPEGTDCLVADIASVMTGKVALDQRIWNGAIVDGLAPYAGQTVPVKLDWSKGQSGYPYIVPVALTNEEQEMAGKFYEEEDPFHESEGSQPPWGDSQGPSPEWAGKGGEAPAETKTVEAARW